MSKNRATENLVIALFASLLTAAFVFVGWAAISLFGESLRPWIFILLAYLFSVFAFIIFWLMREKNINNILIILWYLILGLITVVALTAPPP